jgi:outer membrane protein assembly factor BamB
MGARDGSEYLFELDSNTGKEVWSTRIGTLFENGWGDGPRGTPTVDGERVYAISGDGDLICVEAGTGKKRWELNLQRNLCGRMMSGWGHTESPLVDGDMVVCTPGGAQGTLAALDKKTGVVLWRSKELTDPAAYSSIIIAEVAGIRQYVQMTADGVVGVAARDGRLLWHSGQSANPTAVIPTPIFHDGYVYVTSGYGAGCGLMKLTAHAGGVTAHTIYSNRVMKNQHGGVVLVGGHVYGYSDGDGWVCQDFKTGKPVWTERRRLGKGSLTCAENHLYCYSEDDGTVVLIEATPTGWQESGRFKIRMQTGVPRKSGHIWTHPVVANGRLYLRDQNLIFCFDVKASRAS